MKNLLFLDFDDSFTHNVVQDLKRSDVSIEVVRWDTFTGKTDHDLLVLGPGPGRPEDYESIMPALRTWLSREKKIFGVCLGHQIFWSLRGAQIEKSKRPLHGQKVKLTLSSEWKTFVKLPQESWVQRYNSLCVKGEFPIGKGELLHVEAEELVMSLGPRHITYQFHPESMGTMCRHAFFGPVFTHLL